MTVDKEAILRKHVSTITFGKLIGTPMAQVFEAMDSYAASLIKENEELKATNIKLRFDKLQLETLRDELQQSCDDKNHVMKSWWASLEEADVKIKALQSSNEAKDREIAELKNTVQKLSDALASIMTPNQ